MDTVTTRYPYQQQLSSDKSLEEVETAGVVVGKAAGRMEVKVKVKQTETVAGPKVRTVHIPYYVYSICEMYISCLYCIVLLNVYMHGIYYKCIMYVVLFTGNCCIVVGD